MWKYECYNNYLVLKKCLWADEIPTIREPNENCKYYTWIWRRSRIYIRIGALESFDYLSILSSLYAPKSSLESVFVRLIIHFLLIWEKQRSSLLQNIHLAKSTESCKKSFIFHQYGKNKEVHWFKTPISQKETKVGNYIWLSIL